MVKYRPDPRGVNSAELLRWQATIGPFKSTGFYYTYYKLYDYALKNPSFAALGLVFGTLIPYLCYTAYSTYNSPSDLPLLHKQSEYLFEHSQWASDSRKIRGEWNNNFACWRDSPDCGKDYKKRYFS